MVSTRPDYSSKWRSDTPTFNINTGEIARRINPVSSPDGRGRVRWFDDMQGIEDSWQYQVVGAGSNSVTTQFPYTGDQAFRLTTGIVAGQASHMFKILDPGLNPRIGVEVFVANIDKDGRFVLQMSCSNDGFYAIGGLRIDIKNDKVHLNPHDPIAWTEIADHEFSDINRAFMSMKLVGDFSTAKWVRAIVNGVEYNISAYDWTQAAGAHPYRVGITLKAQNIDAEACVFNIGGVFITDNEP